MTKNLLIWPRAAGIGDTFSILAEGMTVFREKPFRLIICRESVWEEAMMAAYREHYFNICRSFKLCTDVEILKFEHDDEALSYGDEKKSEGFRVHVVNYMGLENAKDNIRHIRERFYKFYAPIVDEHTQALIDDDKINICIHMKRSQRRTEKDNWVSDWHIKRSVDLEKWKEYIAILSENKSINIICIGVKKEYHPFHLSLGEMSDLLERDNVQCQDQEDESIIKDSYLIKHSDIFIGSSSGPTHIAWLLAKPSIVFDYKRLRKALKIFLFELLEDQKICWGNQTVEEMVKYSQAYINSFVPFIKEADIAERVLKQKHKLACVLAEFSSEKREELKKCVTFQEIYFRVFELYLNEGKVDKALEYEDNARGFVNFDDKYQFFRIARLFKDSREYEKAESYFRESIAWCEGSGESGISGASFFHLGEIFLESGREQEAMDCFINCINNIPEHGKAGECFNNLLENADKSYVVWCDSNLKNGCFPKGMKNRGFITNDSGKWNTEEAGYKFYAPHKTLELKPDFIFIKKTEADFSFKQIKLMNLNFNFRVVLLNE